ncbi:MAG: DUF1800 domain-containing protein [Actinomyces sp.]|nr:MAG: DUF1800 domain-containing protein [Actinomyces sp.]
MNATPVDATIVDDETSSPVHPIGTLLRRVTFGPDPGQLPRLASRRIGEVAAELLASTDDTLPAADAERLRALGDDDGSEETLVAFALSRVVTPSTGIHERLVWYWHGHLTTSLDKVPPPLVARQHLLIRRHALGDFRQLMAAIVRDPAMLVYLDGDGSIGEKPNENLARELLELFTLGRGHYGEDDVKAGARALSGWWVDWDTGEAVFDPDSHADGTWRFLGRRVRDVDDVVDAACDHPACAPFVAGRLFHHLVGTEPSPARLDQLAGVFRRADLAILPLVEAIVTSPEITDPARGRPTLPLEWMATAARALGVGADAIDPWWLITLGQLPFYPPNVAGWPLDGRWLGGHQVAGRLAAALELADTVDPDRLHVPDAATALALCGRTLISPTTRSVLDRIGDGLDPETASILRLVAALVSPEVSVR